MTREDVAKACGLDDPIEYIKRTGKGRTTAMLCGAVASAALGKRVFILAFRTSYAQRLCAKARRMARLCRVDDTLFDPMSFEWEEDGGTRGLRDRVLMRDHHRPI